VNFPTNAEPTAIMFFLTKSRPDGERAGKGLEQEKTEATETLSFRSLFPPFPPVRKFFIRVHLPRYLRAKVFSRSLPRFLLRQNFTTDFTDSMDKDFAFCIQNIRVISAIRGSILCGCGCFAP